MARMPSAVWGMLCFSAGMMTALFTLSCRNSISPRHQTPINGGISDGNPYRMGPKSHVSGNQQCHEDDDTEAKRLERNVRVLCWIMTAPQNLDSKAIHVKNTWGRRCNKLLFMSSVKNDSFPTVGLNLTEGREHLTAKSRQAFKYVHDNHFHDADWFLKADDDTYVILENLRHFLSDKNTNLSVFYGHHFFPSFLKPLSKQGYASGGGGYVLSKAALVKFVSFGNNPSLCKQDGGMEDIETSLCLEKLNVTRGKTTDSQGRRRFNPFPPKVFLHGSFNSGFSDYDGESKAIKGMGSLSDYAVSFHYIPPPMMYDLEFYVYHLRPYGMTSHPQDIKIPI